jgi:hypothetical protein
MMSDLPRVFIFDIETVYNIMGVHQLLNRGMIPFQAIKQERYMVTAAWKWLGESKVHGVSLLDDEGRFKKDIHDDYHVVKTLRDAMLDADAIVAHYGNKFDVPWLRTRMAYHRITPLPKVKQIDTYSIAKTHFKFNSNRLDYLGEYLGVGRKLPTDYTLWDRCYEGKKTAIREMLAYNKQDITLLEDVYKVIATYVPNACSVANMHSTECKCGKCGSYNVQKRGPDTSRQAAGWHRLWCKDCKGWSTYKRKANGDAMVR